MNNMEIYNKVKDVPTKYTKKIGAGRLKDMTDIKPQWRIEKLTEVFGPAGIGWYTKLVSKEIIDGADDVEIASMDIELYVNYKKQMNLDEDLWSKPIFGTGANSFVAKERNGLYTSDECFKMAYTDAISVACKALGIGATIYLGEKNNDSKYGIETPMEDMITAEQITTLHTLFTQLNFTDDMRKALYKQVNVTTSKELTKEQAIELIKQLESKVK